MAMQRFKSVDAYMESLEFWQSEVSKLRDILLSTELVEDVKWGMPCYTINGKNVVGLAAFKDYFGLWFHQGVFMSDPAQVLLNPQEGEDPGPTAMAFFCKTRHQGSTYYFIPGRGNSTGKRRDWHQSPARQANRGSR